MTQTLSAPLKPVEDLPRKEKDQKKRFSLFLPLLLGISLTGSILLFVCSSTWGIGINSDAVNYIGGARNILNGSGFRNYSSQNPIIQWPPFYSFTLAAIGLLGIDPLHGARILNVILFGINIFTIGFILKKITPSIPIALIGAGLMLTAPPMLTVHSMACSEAWFIFLTFMGFYFLNEYLDGKPKRFLFYAAGFMAIACLDRYAGVSAIMAGIITILLLHQKNFMTRFKDCTTYTVLSSLPLGLWLLRNYLLSRDLVNREIQPRFASVEYFTGIIDNTSKWILPAHLPASVRYLALVTALLMMTALFILVLRKKQPGALLRIFSTRDSLRFSASMVILIGCTVGLQIAHLILMNASAVPNDRHYSPVFVAALLIFLVLLHEFLKSYPYRSVVTKIPFLFLVLLGLSYLPNANKKLSYLHKEGGYFTRHFWVSSPTLNKLKALPQNALIYSNEPTVIYILTNRQARGIPRKYVKKYGRNDDQKKLSSDFTTKMEKIKQRLISQKGYVVFFDRQYRWFDVPENELPQYFPLVLVEKFSDGTLYQANPDAS